MPRYSQTTILDNKTDFYSFLREKKNIKNLRHYATPVLSNPDLIDRINTNTMSYVWTYGDRFYKLAHKHYGIPEYWWVIAWWNGIPTEADIVNGTVIQLPVDLQEGLIALGAY